MSKLSPLVVFFAAALITLWAKMSWSHEAMPGRYPPPVSQDRYAHPWQQRPYWPAPPRGYGQTPPPRYPQHGTYPATPATPSAAAVVNPPGIELEQTQEQLSAKHAELEEARTKLEALHDKLQHSLESELALNKKVTGISDEQESLQIRMAEMGSMQDQLQSDLASRDEQLAAVQAELKAATEALAQARAKSATSSEALSEAHAQAETIREELARLEEQKASLLTARQTCSVERDRLNGELASRDKKLTALQAELQAATSSHAFEEVHAQAEKSANELAGIKAELESRTTTQQKTETALAAVTAERDSLQAELTARSEQLAKVEATLTSAEAETGPAAEIATLQTSVQDSDADGVPDNIDLCSDTKQGTSVEATGCAVDAAIQLEGVQFGYDSYELNDATRKALDRVAGILGQQPELQLEVAGHTDNQGDPAYNQWLSLQRAETVRDYLIEQGLNPGHIGAGGYGGQRPIADNSTKEGLQANRRVELRRLQ